MRQEPMDRADIWTALAEKLPPDSIAWRQDGRPITRDGRHMARFVAYVEANTVRERLDSVIPGEWDLTLSELPPIAALDDDANMGVCNFKARLQILGVIREDVGTGKDYKQAATDAFKRAAVRFGIGHELYDFEQNWVQVDGDGKYAKPLEDPGVAYARRQGRPTAMPTSANVTTADVAQAPPTFGPLATAEVTCPKCGGRTWDNRLTKRNPKAPDYKCRDRSCDGVVWPDKGSGEQSPADGGVHMPDDEGRDDERQSLGH